MCSDLLKQFTCIETTTTRTTTIINSIPVILTVSKQFYCNSPNEWNWIELERESKEAAEQRPKDEKEKKKN